jgi:hypothetical protein
MPELERQSSHLTEALAASEAAPLSAKKAMLAVLLVDAAADGLAGADDDVLAVRAGLAATSPALALVFELAAMREGGARLVTEAVAVPLSEYGTLRVEDFMVSLYNQHTVQRVRIARGDARWDVHEVLREAVAALRG